MPANAGNSLPTISAMSRGATKFRIYGFFVEPVADGLLFGACKRRELFTNDFRNVTLTSRRESHYGTVLRASHAVHEGGNDMQHNFNISQLLLTAAVAVHDTLAHDRCWPDV
jgi:hypothetical protein